MVTVMVGLPMIGGAEVGDVGFSGDSGNASGGVDGHRSDATGTGSIDYGGAGGVTSHSSKTTSKYHWGLKYQHWR